MREELQKYLSERFPDSKIATPHSIPSEVHIRFELGGDEMFKIFRNGNEIEWWKDKRRMTKIDKLNHQEYIYNRVLQATKRATTIFHDAFNNSESELWVLIYQYIGGLLNRPTNYLFQQFPVTVFETFYDKLEQVDTRMISTDEYGNDYFDKTEARVLVGKVKAKDIHSEQILNGIANNETGFEPSISQDVYFIDPITDIGFYMYDDRGCYVWSNNPEKIRKLYNNRNEWIVEDHRESIDEYFKY